MPKSYVSIGSNIHRDRHTRGALHALQRHFGALEISPVYETAAEGFEGEPFWNLVVGLSSFESPEALNAVFKGIEAAEGRRRDGPKFSARTLDIDLLLYGDEIIERPPIMLPRDEIERYGFVLQPLVDLLPDMHYPGKIETFSELWQQKLASGLMAPAQKIAFVL